MSSTPAPSKLLRVLVCGGGNAAHVLVGQLAARGHLATMLSTYPKEADCMRQGCDANDGVEVRGWGTKGAETIRGRPLSIVGTFAEAFSSLRSPRGVRYDVVLLAVPAPHHDAYLKGLAPYLAKSSAADAHDRICAGAPEILPTILAAAVAQGGFDMAARQALGDANVTGEVIIAGLETLPWACRIIKQGAVAEVLGTKDTVDAAVAVFGCDPSNLTNYAPAALEVLQIAVGPTPKLNLASGFLGVTLSNVNAFWHPTLMWHRWRDWDGTPVSGPAPLLYEHAPDDLACDLMSDEVEEVVSKIRERYPTCIDDLSSARGVNTWFLNAYGDEKSLNKTSTATMMRTNPAYKGLTHPMRPANDDDDTDDPKKKLVPDFQHRYIAEDVGYGLVVIRGIAELVGVETLTIDKVILWAQRAAKLSYLKEVHVADKPAAAFDPPRLTCSGADLDKTRCPQRFGYVDLSTFMRSNGYAFAETKNTVEAAKDTPTTEGVVERRTSANAA